MSPKGKARHGPPADCRVWEKKKSSFSQWLHLPCRAMGAGTAQGPLYLIWGTHPGVRKHPLPPKWDWKNSQLEMFRVPLFFHPPLEPSELQHKRRQVSGWRPGVWAELLLPQAGDYRSCARLGKGRREVSGRHESKGRVQRAWTLAAPSLLSFASQKVGTYTLYVSLYVRGCRVGPYTAVCAECIQDVVWLSGRIEPCMYLCMCVDGDLRLHSQKYHSALVVCLSICFMRYNVYSVKYSNLKYTTQWIFTHLYPHIANT